MKVFVGFNSVCLRLCEYIGELSEDNAAPGKNNLGRPRKKKSLPEL